MVGFVSVQGVSTFPHFQVHNTNTLTASHWNLPRPVEFAPGSVVL